MSMMPCGGEVQMQQGIEQLDKNASMPLDQKTKCKCTEPNESRPLCMYHNSESPSATL